MGGAVGWWRVIEEDSIACLVIDPTPTRFYCWAHVTSEADDAIRIIYFFSLEKHLRPYIGRRPSRNHERAIFPTPWMGRTRHLRVVRGSGDPLIMNRVVITQ